MAFDPNQPFTIVEEEVAFDPTKPFSIVSEETPAIEESSGVLRQVADIPLKFAQGGISSAKSFTDLFGADNAMSKDLAGYEKWVGSLVSAESKKDDEEIARILKDAENKGVYDKVVAGLQAFSKAPLEMTAQSAGYMIPQLAAGVLGKAAQFTKAGIIGTQAAIGFAQGAGQAKGDIYESTLDYLRKQGVPENVANDKAIEAQATLGKNLDQILLSAIGNALTSSTGAEAIATRILIKQGKEATGGAIKGFLKGVAAESPLEAIQSAQQEVAKNVAIQREGGDVPTFKGAIESATTGAVAGAFIGGPLGAFEAMSAEQKAEIEITKEANRKARDLEAPDTATQAIAAAITNLERGIDNKRKDLDVLESTSPEASKLRLDIAADQKILAQSKEQANKLGLSETITEAEKQQIELAKQIAAPEVAAPAPTEVTPTEVAVAEAATPVPVEQVVTPPVEVAPTIAEAAPVEPTKEIIEPKEQTLDLGNNITADFIGQGDVIIKDKDGEQVGRFESSSMENGLQAIIITFLEEDYRGKGIGQKVVQKLKDIYGSIASDVTSDMSRSAESMWINAGAKIEQITEGEDIQSRYVLRKEIPAPVTEQAAPAEAPAPEVAPVQRDVTKPEQMTPEELWSSRYEGNAPSLAKGAEDVWWNKATSTSSKGSFTTHPMMASEKDGKFLVRLGSGMKSKIKSFNSKREAFLAYKRQGAGATGNALIDVIEGTPQKSDAIIYNVAVKQNKPVSAQAVDTYGITLPEGYTKQGDLYVYQPATAKPKLGEKGGVLIPTKEDFIQAGQNIYEKGMEFGAWAKQMIQQFGDAVREFLGEVWQAVSGAPAKLNELMGYLPGKGEAGAVNIGRGEKQPSKATEPVTEKPTETATEKPTPKREQVMGEKIGALKKTPEGIIAETQAKLRERFDPTKVTEQNTTEAFRALGRLTGKEGNAFAQELNDIGRMVDESGAASEISMGAALFVNDLFEYSVRLAADGQKMMLGIMMTNINKLPAAGIGRSDAGRQLRAAKEMKTTFLTMAQAEQDAFVNYAAEFVYGPNPTQEQIDSIKIGYDAVEKVEEPTAEEVEEEIKSVGEKSGTDLVDKIKEEIDKAVAPENKDPIVAAMLALQKLYGGTIETKYLAYSEAASKIKEGVKNILQGGITNYRKKMVEGAASGLETGFWKTLASEQKRIGPLGELDNAQNRELGNIVKSMLISLGLKGKLGKPLSPDEKKMDIYEQVASILGEKPLSKDKIVEADKRIRDEIKRKLDKELESTEDENAQKAIEAKWAQIQLAWDEAMSSQLDMPISGSMLRRLIYNDLKEAKTSIKELADLMNEEPVIGARRQESLVNSVIQKIAGITFEGQNPANYSSLKEYLGNQLELMIVSEQTKAKTAKAKAQITKEAKSSIELQVEKAENEAQNQIDRLAKIQSDTPSFPPEAEMNPVREAVKNALKLSFNLLYSPRNEPDAINNLKKNLALQLQSLGVKEGPATILANVVARQVEINSLNNKFKAIDRAVEKGPISEIVNAVKNTPLEEQQKPNWRYNVMLNYLRKAGLHIAQAERIAKLMDISLQKRFVQGKEQAFTDAISKTAPWKSGNIRSKRAFQQVLQAIRAGALDPSRNMVSDIAAMNGWTGFTAEQYKVLLKNDTILANKESKDIQKAEAYKAIQDIISKSKLPIRARDVIGQYYDAQALSGIPTLSVNSFSPIAFAMRNAIVEAGSGTIKGDARAIGRAVTTFVDSIKSWANTVAFSFKNNTTVYSNVDYIVNDDNLLRLYRRGVDQFTKGKTPRDRADGVKNMMIGMMDYVRRALNALDYGAIASLQNQNISKYAMAVMKRQKMTDKQANEMFGVMMKAKNDFYLQQIAIGTDKNKASILSDEFYISSWKEALSKAGVEKSEIQQAMDAAINDALSSVGRNRQSLDAFKEESTKLKDAGVASAPALWLLESMANAANQSDSQAKKLFARIIYGYSIVPARVIRETAWFSPYGFVRFGWDAIAKAMGKTSPYAQSLGTDVQYSQRLNEATAGTVALLGLMALRAGSTDDPEDKEEFKIVFTGNGPQRKDDAQFYDSWYKAGNKPNSMIVSFGKTKFALNMMRGFEAFTWPAIMLGAVDDLEIRTKQKQKPNSSVGMEDAAIVAGFVFDAALRRGPYAFTTKSLFGTYGDIGVEGVAKGLTFPAKTLIPVLGTSLASNLSNFLNDPIDRRTLDGAVWSNIPFIGPAVAPKSLNAFGEPALSTDMASKMFKLGVPIVFDIPTDRESIKLHELVLKQGGGPSIPTRNQLAQRLDRQPTNKEYEMFVREYGASLTKSMKSSYNYLFNAKPELYSKRVEKIGLRARDAAESKVKRAARNP